MQSRFRFSLPLDRCGQQHKYTGGALFVLRTHSNIDEMDRSVGDDFRFVLMIRIAVDYQKISSKCVDDRAWDSDLFNRCREGAGFSYIYQVK
jgi:hypothetical protein